MDEAKKIANELESLLPKKIEIQAYLDHLATFYNDTIGKASTAIDVYAELCNIEKDYAVDKNCENYAKQVHRMYPEVLKKDEKGFTIKGQNGSVLDRLRCSHCNTRLSTEEAYRVHILNAIDHKCRLCGVTVTSESINIKTFVKDFDSNRYGLLKDSNLKMSSVPISDTWKEFMENVSPLLEKSHAREISREHTASKAAVMQNISGAVKSNILGPGNGQLVLASPPSMQFGGDVLLGSESPVGGDRDSTRSATASKKFNGVQSPGPSNTLVSKGEGSSHSGPSITSSRHSSFSSLHQYSEISYVPTYDNGDGKTDILIRREQLYKIVNDAKGNLSKFGIDLVHVMYRHMDLTIRICNNLEYWQKDEVIESAINRYHRFMILLRKRNQTRNPMKPLCPTLDILLVWHAHRLNHWNYHEYNVKLNAKFGLASTRSPKIIDDSDIITPYRRYSDISRKNFKDVELSLVRSAFAKTCIRWSRLYNEPYSLSSPSFGAWQNGHSLTSWMIPPVGIYRLSKWLKYKKAPLSSKDSSSSQDSDVKVGSPLLYIYSEDKTGISEALIVINSNGGSYPYGGHGFPRSFLEHHLHM